MGSSAFGATAFKKLLLKNNVQNVDVKNFRIEGVPNNADIIVVHKSLEDRVKISHSAKVIVSIENYLDDKKLDKLLKEIISKQN